MFTSPLNLGMQFRSIHHVNNIHINATYSNGATLMYSASPSTHRGGISAWAKRSEAWLDRKGPFAWIAAMVLGFVLFWPIGLALLAYMIWSNRMFSRSCGDRHTARRTHDAHASSGNAAFDAYKSDMLRRLEDEQRAFEGFLQRLRDAKDKSEFDAFMEDRARAAANDAPAAPQAPTEGRAGAY